MERPSKLLVTSLSTPPTAARLQDWADLPDGLLHSIIARLRSFLDIFSFDATCHSWHDAFCSYPSKSTFCNLCPPLLIQPSLRLMASHPPSNDGCGKLCKVVDPANGNTIRGGKVLRESLWDMHFVSSSYGQLICCHHGYCLVVDAFSGAEVSLPRLPLNDYCESAVYNNGTLTGPLASPNCHFLISTHHILFDWSAESHSWSSLKLPNLRIEQIVRFNGQLIAMDSDRNIYKLHLSPLLGLQEIKVGWCGHVNESSYFKSWLVVCGDMLLMVSYHGTCNPRRGSSMLHRLDMSTEPARWVKLLSLDNWALFVGIDRRSPPISCMNPEQWGGKSNSLYYPDYSQSQRWDVRWLGDKPDTVQDPSLGSDLIFRRTWYRYLQALWVYPSAFYSIPSDRCAQP